MICYFEVEIHNFFICLFGFWRRIDYLKCRNERKKYKSCSTIQVWSDYSFGYKLQSYNCKSILVLQDIMENPTGHGHSLPWSTGYWIFGNLAYDKRESRLAPRERTIVVGGDSRECKVSGQHAPARLFQNHGKWRGMRVSVFRKTNLYYCTFIIIAILTYSLRTNVENFLFEGLRCYLWN